MSTSKTKRKLVSTLPASIRKLHTSSVVTPTEARKRRVALESKNILRRTTGRGIKHRR